MSKGSISIIVDRRSAHARDINACISLRRLGRPHGTTHWTSENFFHHIYKLNRERIAVIYISLSIIESVAFVIFDDEAIPIELFVERLATKATCFLIMVVDGCDSFIKIRGCLQELDKLILAVMLHCQSPTVGAILACEIFSWLSLGYCSNEDFAPISAYNSAVKVLVSKLAEHNIIIRAEYASNCKGINLEEPFFPNLLLPDVSTEVDIDKFIFSNIRSEQIEDALKRLSDVFCRKRSLHASKREVALLSQANFIACQIDPTLWDFDWFAFSNLGREFGLRAQFKERSLNRSWAVLDNGRLHALANYILGLNYAEVPTGMYPIGLDADFSMSEPPSRAVQCYVNSFRISVLTAANEMAFVAGLLEEGDKEPHLPWVNITALQVMELCDSVTGFMRANGTIDRQQLIRLPTEVEWEVAANGGERKNYPWGDYPDPSRCNAGMSIGRPTSVSSFRPEGDSSFGCSNLAGNVREWTCSYAGARGVDWSELGDPDAVRTISTISLDDRLVVRGGSYSYGYDCVQTWVRNSQIASRSDKQTGFRLVIAYAEG